LFSTSPSIPSLREGFEIPEKYTNLDNGEQFLQFDSGSDDNKRILIFGSDTALTDLTYAKNWAGDGTFKSSPTIFYQLYIIHVQHNEISVPRLFCLLPDKTEETYTRLFEAIKCILGNLYEPEVM
jgi:hypothetical protein